MEETRVNESEVARDWPFPSVDAYNIRVPDKGVFLTLSGSPGMIESYRKKFGCVPVYTGNPPRRKLARLAEDGKWLLSDPDGTTGLEAPPALVNPEEVNSILTGYDWFHIGYNVNPELVEFHFDPGGEGFSRRSIWGFDTVVPDVQDFYWNFLVKGDTLTIRWEDQSETSISFFLKRQLHVASSLRDDSLRFFEMSLQVSASLFPPQASFAQYLLKEYWGQPKQRTGKDAPRLAKEQLDGAVQKYMPEAMQKIQANYAKLRIECLSQL